MFGQLQVSDRAQILDCQCSRGQDSCVLVAIEADSRAFEYLDTTRFEACCRWRSSGSGRFPSPCFGLEAGTARQPHAPWSPLRNSVGDRVHGGGGRWAAYITILRRGLSTAPAGNIYHNTYHVKQKQPLRYRNGCFLDWRRGESILRGTLSNRSKHHISPASPLDAGHRVTPRYTEGHRRTRNPGGLHIFGHKLSPS